MQKIINRNFLINEIAKIINQINLPHPTSVAVDGPGNAGKTTFANELENELIKLGRSVIRSTIDGFHHPPEIRRRQGQFSPKGYLEDSHNCDAVIENILKPLGKNGNLVYKESVYDFKISKHTNPEIKKAEKNSILIFDGIFLFREELVNYWNYKIYLESSFEKTTQRAILRDSKLFGGKEKVIELYKKRYIPGHEMYLIMRNPIGISDIVINNNEFQNPTVIKISNNAYNKDILRIFDNFQKEEIY